MIPAGDPFADALDAQADALDATAAASAAQARALRAQAAAVRAGHVQPASPSTAPLVSRHEAARLLSISLATLDRLDREGQPFVRVGDAKRYDVAAVLAWHRERTAAEPMRLPPAPEPAPVEPSGVRRVSVGGRGRRHG